MRLVPVTTEAWQAQLCVHRARQAFVEARTAVDVSGRGRRDHGPRADLDDRRSARVQVWAPARRLVGDGAGAVQLGGQGETPGLYHEGR